METEKSWLFEIVQKKNWYLFISDRIEWQISENRKVELENRFYWFFKRR